MMNFVKTYTLFTDHDVYLFKEGIHYRLYEKFGAHSVEKDGVKGVYFSVWAPNAKKVSVIGNFNNWNHREHILFPRWDQSGIWEGFIPALSWGTLYKYAIETAQGKILEKSDPYALSWEQNLQAASMVSTNWYEWEDQEWLDKRWQKNSLDAPISVYEIHLASWMRDEDHPEKFLNYREIASKLVPYITEMGFTHVEFMPVMEYPYDPSWGYQITGFFAATSRFGSPQDLMFLINELHKNDIGVILDWVPSHFPGDANGLHCFDGSYLYEHEDPRKGFHPDWKSYIFNYGRNEVKSFLISNAVFWLDRYHADGLRVDAVTSMLHLDYSRNEGEWEPNIYGENVNLEAKAFLQEFNTAVYKEFGNNIITIAEESSDFPMLTKPVHDGGVGFGMKWMMGWMHDTLFYFKEDHADRKYHHHKLTFSSMYMYNENYMIPFSHDEVVHGKASLIYKMKGDEWQKFANLRALYVYMFTHPGAKLLFMGDEFGQTNEWNFKQSLDWHLLQYPVHKGLQTLVKDLNHLYKNETAFYENQFNQNGFEWVEANDTDNSVYIYLRKGKRRDDVFMVILNLTPNVLDYKVGVNLGTHWEVVLNSDDEKYSGSGVEANIFREDHDEWMNCPRSISLNLPALSGIVLRQKKDKKYKLNRIKQHKK
ncbi:1,4-alpha-glucan branching protein GlgB [Chryseobacterium balustinum]|uniref:1,4-alpha-glucan branching enzyme GlgB n=2 Tax=Chryseobacterium balustinum TaxID=246 RepID=A0AAX2IN31_9FLAO|nr:1,4-alpha-glucan branching protein GlgB [Chryseobacterium balustinum]SKB62009.1 1,4-alpha-glucan branching enzyme [Chryseobacterium balustinum]SQA91270.1 1,4-alpha-glucan branching enzyme GlgB [Chryseobacterium balustinum]